MKITTIPLAILCSLLLINFVCAFKVSLGSLSAKPNQIITDQPEGPAIPYNEAKAKEYAYYSMITHCTDSQITNWSCKLCKTNVLTDVALIQNATYDIAGYVGYSKTHNQIIFSWRGTVDMKNWEVDFKYKLTKYTPKSGTCTDCQIHTGILQAYRSV
jgi:ribosomal protein S26